MKIYTYNYHTHRDCLNKSIKIKKLIFCIIANDKNRCYIIKFLSNNIGSA